MFRVVTLHGVTTRQKTQYEKRLRQQRFIHPSDVKGWGQHSRYSSPATIRHRSGVYKGQNHQLTVRHLSKGCAG